MARWLQARLIPGHKDTTQEQVCDVLQLSVSACQKSYSDERLRLK
jgi:hypothetical protein